MIPPSTMVSQTPIKYPYVVCRIGRFSQWRQHSPKVQSPLGNLFKGAIQLNREAIYHAINFERIRQNGLHPEWHGDQHGLVVLAEEFGEVAKALYENNPEELKSELIQVAAVCVRWLENFYK